MGNLPYALIFSSLLASGVAAASSLGETQFGQARTLSLWMSGGACFVGYPWECHPLSAKRETGHFSLGTFLLANTFSLQLAEVLLKDSPSLGDIERLARETETGDLLGFLSIEGRYGPITIEADPIAYSGHFTVRNPNLPFMSAAFREDARYSLLGSTSLTFSKLEIEGTTALRYVLRRESLIEESALSMLTVKKEVWLWRERRKTVYWDGGLRLEALRMLNFGLSLNNVMLSQEGKSPDKAYLYIRSDEEAYGLLGLGLRAGGDVAGVFSLGVSRSIAFPALDFSSGQWHVVSGYHLGPFGFTFALGDTFSRSSLEILLDTITFGMGQEWKRSESVSPDFSSQLIFDIRGRL